MVFKRHQELNPNFPYQLPVTGRITPPKMSESLMCFRSSQITSVFATNVLLLSPLNRDYYAKRVERNRGLDSIFFLKHGYSNLGVRSHQFRHFLSTLMRQSGLPIEMITKWASRASDSQSAVYMHQSVESRFNQISERRGLLTIATMPPISEYGYGKLVKGPLQISRYGVCAHDYTFSPCRKFHDCLSCSGVWSVVRGTNDR